MDSIGEFKVTYSSEDSDFVAEVTPNGVAVRTKAEAELHELHRLLHDEYRKPTPNQTQLDIWWARVDALEESADAVSA